MAKDVVVYTNAKKGKIVKQTRERKHNFLKHWRVVRYWAKRKYNISDSDLEILLYLYDIDLFTRKQFRAFEGLLTWDKTRFNTLRDKGHIIQRREDKTRRQAKLYTLSVACKRMLTTVYKKLTQEEHIPTNRHNNPIFSGDSYADKMYRQAIRRMNEERERKMIAQRNKDLGID